MVTSASVGTLFGLRLRVFLVVQQDEGEQEHAGHHGERAYVIRERARYEAFVLRVLQRTHGDLRGAVEMRQADARVVHLELVHPVYIGDLEPALVAAVPHRFHGHSHEWVDPHELQLQIVRFVGHPLAVRQPLNLDRVHHVVHDRIRGRRLRLANPMVVNGRHAYDTVLLEHPLRYRLGHHLIARLLVSLTTCEQSPLSLRSFQRLSEKLNY